MAIYHHHNFGININPPLPPGSQVGIALNHISLFLLGLNIPVEISTASAFRQSPDPLPLNSTIVMAHFDTGASITSIDISLAEYLKLIPSGLITNNTAGGIQEMPTYAIDINFPNTNLNPFINLRVGSCKLQFDLNNNIKNSNNPKNFGLLLGRDIMSKWNIVWNGPTSTVFISD